MLRITITFLTAAIMLAHGLFGCCWHHEHSAAAVHGEGEVASEHAGHRHAVASGHLHHSCTGDQGEDETPASPCPSECDGQRCVFVRTTDSGSFDAGMASVFAAFGTDCVVLDVVSAAERSRPARFGLHESSSAAAPLHARLHVWQI